MNTMKQRWVVALLLAIIVGGGIGVYLSTAKKDVVADGGQMVQPQVQEERHLGGMTGVDGLTITPSESGDGLKVGTTSPTTVTNIITGKCNLTSFASLGATSTLRHFCAVTGVVAGDKVFASLPLGNSTSTVLAGPGGFGALALVGVQASTTAGFIELAIENTTGVATASYPLATTSVSYWIIR